MEGAAHLLVDIVGELGGDNGAVFAAPRDSDRDGFPRGVRAAPLRAASWVGSLVCLCKAGGVEA